METKNVNKIIVWVAILVCLFIIEIGILYNNTYTISEVHYKGSDCEVNLDRDLILRFNRRTGKTDALYRNSRNTWYWYPVNEKRH